MKQNSNPGKFKKTILITGASSGIGAALAKYYADVGVFLYLNGRNEARLKDVAKQCEGKGAVVDLSLIDVRQGDEIKSWIEMAENKNQIDLVIANAGISSGTGGQDDCEDFQRVREVFDINLTGVLNTIDPILPYMIRRGSGQIAIMSSLVSFSGWPSAPSYSASKGAVRMYGEALRGSLNKSGVKINVICPGFIKTPMTDINDYPMPFLMSDERAAKIIYRGLRKNKGRISFPWPSYIVAGLLGIMPYSLSSIFLNKTPKKPST